MGVASNRGYWRWLELDLPVCCLLMSCEGVGTGNQRDDVPGTESVDRVGAHPP